MLVDLEWTIEYAHTRDRTEWIKEFNTQGGNLVTTIEFPPDVKTGTETRIWRRVVAEKASKGVYWAWDLWNDIETYTKWSVEHPWTESKAIFDAMVEATNRGDTEEHARLRDRLNRIQPEYGNVDTLKDVFRKGHTFIQSADPYVLEIRQVDLSNRPDSDRYFDKNGGYKGKGKTWELKEVLHYCFHKLVKKRTPCQADTLQS